VEVPISYSDQEEVGESHEKVVARAEPLVADETGVGFLYAKRN